jgi:hypothetical protein
MRFDLVKDRKRGPHRRPPPTPLQPLYNRHYFFCYISEIHFFVIRSCRHGIKRKHSHLIVLPPPPPPQPRPFLGGPVCLSILSPLLSPILCASDLRQHSLNIAGLKINAVSCIVASSLQSKKEDPVRRGGRGDEVQE